MVIDIMTPFSQQQFNTYHSLAWLMHDSIAFHDQGGVKIEPIGTYMNFTVNENKLRYYESVASRYYKFVGPVIVIFIFNK